MVLDRQYVFRYCSPTRRSFLSGRFPNRITSVQADNANYCSDLLPLAFETLPEKLQKVGYRSHMIGKLHLGYQTVDHLPVNRGFESHVGYLAGSQPYTYGGGKPDPYSGGHDMWLNHAPGTVVVPELSYATNYYARRAVEIVEAHPADDPLFMYLALQVMHEPYTDPPEWQQHDYPDFPGDRTFANMLFSMDETVRNVTDALRRTGMWDNTLVVFMADNGGTGLGNSHPLRGQKHDPWEGGVRAAAFMSGGFVPKKLRNTSSGPKMVHIADWYATFAELAGASSADNVTMKGAVRPIDGVNVWPLLTQKHTPQPRPITPVSETAIIEVVDDATWWKFVNLAGLIAWISYCMDMCALAGLPCIRP